VIFINKLDRERADFQRTFLDAKENFEPKPIILQLPIGAETDFKGIVDLINSKAVTYDTDGKGKKGEIPSELQDSAGSEAEELIENIAEADDELVERYLEGETLTEDELKAALRKGTLSRTFVPVICGSATKNIGIDLLLDLIVDALPSPADRGSKTGLDPSSKDKVEREPDPNAPFSAFVVKTVADPYAGRLTIFRVVSGSLGADGTFYNSTKETKERYNQLLIITGKEQKPVNGAGPGDIVAMAKLKETTTGDTLCDDNKKIVYECAEPLTALISFAIVAKSKGDEDKVFSSLTKLLEEDPSLTLDRRSETKVVVRIGTDSYRDHRR
jgi:elongation factor G